MEMKMGNYLREMLEIKRHDKLFRQIGALERQIEYLGMPRTMWERIRIAKLKSKIARLKDDLNQPMLIDTSRLSSG
jgi:hypothetical protein